jgi:hypothetical protein
MGAQPRHRLRQGKGEGQGGMSKWKNRSDGKTVRRRQIEVKQWAWLSIEAMESPAYRALSLSGHRVLARIQIEHAHHGGADNGKLTVTFRDFQEYGVHPNCTAPAIREVAALGFIRITQEGVASSDKEYQIPNMFALTHLPTDNGTGAATNDWHRHKTTEEAEAAAKTARAERPRNRKFAAKTQRKETESRYENRIKGRYENRIRKSQNPDTKTVPLAANENRSTFYISGRGRANGHDRDGTQEGEPRP